MVVAWLFALPRTGRGLLAGWGPGVVASIGLYGVVLVLLISQPDLGQAIVLSGVWVAQFFLAGLSMWLVGGLVAMGVAGLVGAYFIR